MLIKKKIKLRQRFLNKLSVGFVFFKGNKL